MTTAHRITETLRQADAHLTAEEIAQATRSSLRDVTDTLHHMQDEGTVFMRNGFYWLSEAAKAGTLIERKEG